MGDLGRRGQIHIQFESQWWNRKKSSGVERNGPWAGSDSTTDCMFSIDKAMALNTSITMQKRNRDKGGAGREGRSEERSEEKKRKRKRINHKSKFLESTGHRAVTGSECARENASMGWNSDVCWVIGFLVKGCPSFILLQSHGHTDRHMCGVSCNVWYVFIVQCSN